MNYYYVAIAVFLVVLLFGLYRAFRPFDWPAYADRCDGQHGRGPCVDPECWLNDEEPAERAAARRALREAVDRHVTRDELRDKANVVLHIDGARIPLPTGERKPWGETCRAEFRDEAFDRLETLPTGAELRIYAGAAPTTAGEVDPGRLLVAGVVGGARVTREYTIEEVASHFNIPVERVRRFYEGQTAPLRAAMLGPIQGRTPTIAVMDETFYDEDEVQTSECPTCKGEGYFNTRDLGVPPQYYCDVKCEDCDGLGVKS